MSEKPKWIRDLEAMSPEEHRAFMNRLKPTDEEVPLPPSPAELMSVRSIRWSNDLDLRVKATAHKQGMSVSQFVRDAVEMALWAGSEDVLVSRAEVIRVISGLPARGAA